MHLPYVTQRIALGWVHLPCTHWKFLHDDADGIRYGITGDARRSRGDGDDTGDAHVFRSLCRLRDNRTPCRAHSPDDSLVCRPLSFTSKRCGDGGIVPRCTASAFSYGDDANTRMETAVRFHPIFCSKIPRPDSNANHRPESVNGEQYRDR